MKKRIRQGIILELINKYDIENQKELMNHLSEEGIYITQATVSRDIKELKLVKVQNSEGHSVFKVSSNLPEETMNPVVYMSRIETIFKECVVEVENNAFLVIVKTLPGMAQAAAHAIDTININDILGTIAGDDTIFVALKEDADIEEIKSEFEELMESN